MADHAQARHTLHSHWTRAADPITLRGPNTK
jgi:hypothetical protein